MDFTALQAIARTRLTANALEYQAATAGALDRSNRDTLAWQEFDLVPRVLRGLTAPDPAIQLLEHQLATPMFIAPTAAHGLAHRDAERASGAGAARAGALYIYSSSATVEVTEFAASDPGPWWLQLYLMRDRGRSDDYLARGVAAGASAVVFTVDNPGPAGEAPFRIKVQSALATLPANFPGWTWADMSRQIEPQLRWEQIGDIASATGLPVIVKGILHPVDAALATRAGAAAIIVSNHGRRQLDGVIPAAFALPDVVRAVAGRIPVLVDGGIRSGVDALRALALGASAIGVGRPVLWGLAAGGAEGVTEVLTGLTAELKQAMAAVAATGLADVTPDLVRRFR